MPQVQDIPLHRPTVRRRQIATKTLTTQQMKYDRLSDGKRQALKSIEEPHLRLSFSFSNKPIQEHEILGNMTFQRFAY
ncbi:MAG: hypothetical protein SWQ30_05215 [Thermodesulfobacteriota bacterium]|nr:hypothetical protein [Thermodesulfobacteriota bacterium]